MTQPFAEETDRRVRHTRQAIGQAFARLVMSRRYDAIRTADIIAESGVGRSTFYEHFRGKDDILLHSVVHVFASLADAAAGRPDPRFVRAVLTHFWEQRGFARILFAGDMMPKLQRRLAGLIAGRLPDSPPGAAPKHMIATGAAAAQLAMLQVWLSGEAPCPVDTLTDDLIARSRAMTGA